MQTLETTLCLLKPDGVRRGLIGPILTRIEQAGLKIRALKLVQCDEALAGRHYTYEDIAVRHGEAVRKALIAFLVSGPVVALAVEGISAVENLRRLVGSTEPLKAAPGTIRGDFCHHSFALTKSLGQSIRNLIHASATPEEAAKELALWFTPEEYVAYKRADQGEHWLQD